jgi:tetratricopeptide (TPR) repeat protein
MIQDAPWWGVGAGLFSLLYPPYRAPGENSAGFFVHNDYLQLWLEAGLPGLVLLLVALAAVGVAMLRAWRTPSVPLPARFELSGLGAAILATAAHSLVDFNLHVLTILIVLGVFLGRFQALSMASRETPVWRPVLPGLLTRRGYRLIVVLASLFPLLYFGSIAYAVYEAKRAHTLAQEGRFPEADSALERAYRIYPTADNVLVNRADIYRHVLTQLPRDPSRERRALFDDAHEFLERAQALNSLRPLTFLVKARLLEQNPDLRAAGGEAAIEEAYRRALALNPRFYPARHAYAQYLEAAGRPEVAHRVLEEGIDQFLVPHVDVMPYLALTARYRRAAGDAKGAAELGARMEAAMLNSGWERLPVAAVDRPLIVTGARAGRVNGGDSSGPAPVTVPAR